MRRMILLGLLGVVVALMVWIRLAPTDTAQWHVSISETQNRDDEGGVVRILEGDATTLAQLGAAMDALPRTQVLAGSVADGHVTYVTRSLFWGFPDYTTIEQHDGDIRVWARLRFGRSDLGVNRKRLEQVLTAFQ